MTMPKNLRSGIGDLVNELVKVANNTTVAEEQIALQKLINALFILWQQVIIDQLNAKTPEYTAALTALGEGIEAAKNAKKDLARVSEAIAQATRAAKAVDKVVKFVLKLLT